MLNAISYWFEGHMGEEDTDELLSRRELLTIGAAAMGGALACAPLSPGAAAEASLPAQDEAVHLPARGRRRIIHSRPPSTIA